MVLTTCWPVLAAEIDEKRNYPGRLAEQPEAG